MTLVKASIRPTSGGDALQCAFNPTEYSISKTAEWRGTPSSGAPTAPTPEFVGTRPRNLRMKLLFDAWASGEDTVTTAVDQLLEWCNPTSSSISQGRPSPPVLAFTWGQSAFFDAYLQSVDAQYTMFKPDGTPLRASVSVALVEVPNEPAGQNPTSGSLAAQRTARLVQGDSLHSIAYREYGSAELWRGLAAENGIDDPLRVGPGMSIRIPPRERAAELS
ncbi:MAG: peptidase M23 [Gaiellaceae bacterium]